MFKINFRAKTCGIHEKIQYLCMIQEENMYKFCCFKQVNIKRISDFRRRYQKILFYKTITTSQRVVFHDCKHLLSKAKFEKEKLVEMLCKIIWNFLEII